MLIDLMQQRIKRQKPKMKDTLVAESPTGNSIGSINIINKTKSKY